MSNGEKIKFLIKYFGLNQKQLAEKIDMRETMLSRKLSSASANKLNKVDILAICNILEIQMDIFEDININNEKQIIKFLENNKKTGDEQNDFFTQDKTVLAHLTQNDGIWYFYSYPSNYPKIDVRIIKTVINDDFTTIDERYQNSGKIYIGESQTTLIKQTRNAKNLISITFDNSKIPFKMMPFTMLSKANNTTRGMLNFGFCSQTKFSENKAKEILGDIKNTQLIIKSDLVERIEYNTF